MTAPSEAFLTPNASELNRIILRIVPAPSSEKSFLVKEDVGCASENAKAD